MSGRNYLQHGRRHLPGGSDPIPLSDSWATMNGPDALDLAYFGGTSQGWPTWDEDHFYTNDPTTFSFDDSAPLVNASPTGIKISKAGMYVSMQSSIIGGSSGDHTTLFAYTQSIFNRGGSVFAFPGVVVGEAGIVGQQGIYDGSSTHWYPSTLLPFNLRAASLPATITFDVEGLSTLVTAPPIYPRMMVYRLASGIDEDFT